MERIIQPKNKWWQLNWAEFWSSRDLLYLLVWRNIKVKYKQTIVGVAWAIFQPLATMVVFSILFGRYAKIPSDNVPYPIFVFSGLLFWNLFSVSLTEISHIFINNEPIINKIYFPRIILPVSVILTNLVDFVIAFTIFIALMWFYGLTPSLAGVLLFPLLVTITVFSSLGIGLFCGSLNVKYRDVRYMLPFFIQLVFFVTPVIYPVSIIGERFGWVSGLNPMSGVIDIARASWLGGHPINWLLLTVSVLSALIYFSAGYLYFKKVERYFADVI